MSRKKKATSYEEDLEDLEDDDSPDEDFQPDEEEEERPRKGEKKKRSRAAQFIDEDAEEDDEEVGPGLPWPWLRDQKNACRPRASAGLWRTWQPPAEDIH
jgi:hypothetical protein